MARHRIDPAKVSGALQSDTARKLQDAASDIIGQQSFLRRRSNSIAGVANFILQACTFAVGFAGVLNPWVVAVILVLGFVAEIFVHAFTKQALTPNGVQTAVEYFNAVEEGTPDRKAEWKEIPRDGDTRHLEPDHSWMQAVS